MTTQHDKAELFAALHAAPGAFAVPNPWDIGSALILQGLGFKALATTSSGLAQTLGRADGMVTLDEKLEHCQKLAAATDIPITADMENGYADDPESVAACIRNVAATGVVGASIEDYTGNASQPIYEMSLAVERVQAAVTAAAELPFKFVVTARAEHQLRAGDDLDETIRRLQAYEQAGAHVVYAPGLRTLDEVRRVAASVSVPLNVLGSGLPSVTVDAIGKAGGKRVSTGGSLARRVANAIIQTGSALLDKGDLGWVTQAASGAELQAFFARTP